MGAEATGTAGARRTALAPETAPLAPALALGALVAVTAACLPAAFHAMFSGFRDYDDEGYLLLSLRHYTEGVPLYDEVYSQYGPAYFQLLHAAFGLLGITVSHIGGRTLVLGLWLLIAAAAGLVVYRLTRNIPVSAATQLLVFQTLLPLRNEPPHPGGLLSLAVTAIVLLGPALAGPRRVPAAGLVGALLAVATLIKVNVGLLAGLATAFALVAPTGAGPGRHLRHAIALAVVGAPLALMGPLSDLPPVRAFLVVATGAALALVLVERPGPASRLPGSVLGALVAGALVATAASLGWELARGSTAAGLLRGIVLGPLEQPALIALPLPLGPEAAAGALAALAGCLLVVAAERRGWTGGAAVTRLRGPARMLAGALVWLIADERLPLGPLAALPLLWLARVGGAPAAGGAELGRRLLVAMAVLQSLHAYPVAGSQVAWATFLFIPVGALLLVDGWRETAEALARPTWRRAAGAVLAAGALAGVAGSVAETAARLGAGYATGVPLGLPGAEAIRVPAGQARLYRLLARQLAARCTTFVTMPGLNSLYLFTGIEPPTRRNATLWSALLGDREQADIAARLARWPTPVCAVRRPSPDFDRFETPLTRYIREGFVTVFTVGEYAVMVQRRPAHGSEPSEGRRA
jgi:hypothetical protein